MLIPLIAYAAELEQAAAVSTFEDEARSEGYYSPQAVTTRHYGHDGVELMWEYENDIYELELGYLPDFVLFH